jgi:hypothetical protein
MDSGVAVSAVLIFFILQYPKDGTIGANTIQVWWGNSGKSCLRSLLIPLTHGPVPFTNTDYGATGHGTPLLPLPDVGYFGPKNGTW